MPTGEEMIEALERVTKAYLPSSFKLPRPEEPRIKEFARIEEMLREIARLAPSDIDIMATVLLLLEIWSAKNIATVTQCVGVLEIAKKALLMR